MHVLVKPVAAMLAAAPFVGTMVQHQMSAAVGANAVAAACVSRVFAAPEPPGRTLLAVAVLADAAATGRERVAASLCPARPDAR